MTDIELEKKAAQMEKAARSVKHGAAQFAREQEAIQTNVQVQIRKLRDIAERAKA